MQASIDYRQSTRQDTRLRVDLELGLLVTLLGLILFLRITNILYNTLFVDEAIYVTGGRDLLAGLTDRHILAWFGGSFIYPVLTALAANLAGDRRHPSCQCAAYDVHGDLRVSDDSQII